MKTCPNCKSQYTDDKKFCKVCGTALVSQKESEPKFLARKIVFEEKIKAEPLNVSLLTEYAQFLIYNSIGDEAALILYKILAIDQNNLKAQQLLFKNLISTDRTNEAVEIGFKLIKLMPEDIDLLSELSSLLLTKGDYIKTLDLYNRIIKIEPNRSDIWKSKAEVLDKLNKESESFTAWHRVFQIDYTDIDARLYLAIEASKKEEYLKTKELIEPIVEKIDINSEKWFLSAVYLLNALVKLNQGESVISNLYIKIFGVAKEDWFSDKINERLSDVAIYLGNKALEKEEYDNAITYFKNAEEYGETLKSKEGLALTYAKMSDFYFDQKDLITAEQYLNDSIKIDPMNKEVKERHSELAGKISIAKKKRKKSTIIRSTVTIFVVLIVIISSLMISNYVTKQSEENDWTEAKNINTIVSYQAYLNNYPEGKHSIEAKDLIEDYTWQDANSKNTIEAYNDYLNSYPNGKFINEAFEKRKELFKTAISVDKIKQDLLGKRIPGWNFDYLSEFQDVQLTNSLLEGNILSLCLNLKLRDYNTKEIWYAKVIAKYVIQNNGSSEFTNVNGYYYSNKPDNFYVNGKLFIIGKWRWEGNTAEYKPDGTWEGTWDNGTVRNGTWSIVKNDLCLYIGNNVNPIYTWMMGRIISYNNSNAEIDFNGTKNIAERLNASSSVKNSDNKVIEKQNNLNISESSKNSTVNELSIPLTINEWRYYSEADNASKTASSNVLRAIGDGLQFFGSGYRKGAIIFTATKYNLSNCTVYFKWKTHAMGYMAAGPIFVDSPTPSGTHFSLNFLTTDHSWDGSILISDDRWYYTRAKFSNGNFAASMAINSYDDQGGTIINTTSGSFTPTSVSIAFQINDNYTGKSASITVGEVKIIGNPKVIGQLSSSLNNSKNLDESTNIAKPNTAENNVKSKTKPFITSISSMLPTKNQTILIYGSGFGSQSGYTNRDNPYILVHDITRGWNAGYASGNVLLARQVRDSDQITLNIDSWTDSKIVVTGFAGAYGGGWSLHDKDKVEILIWNPQTGEGPATYNINVSSAQLSK